MTKQQATKLLFVDEFEVWVTYKNIRSGSLRVKPPDASIQLSVPFGTRDYEIRRLVRARREWLQQAVRKVQSSRMSQAEEATADEVAEWRAVVEACVPPLVAAWEPILGVKASKLAYRNMKSRWGSCQPETGRICINVRLALYPPECLEYVVVHELCHLLVKGHGSDFHALMTKVMPDWKQRRAKLKA